MTDEVQEYSKSELDLYIEKEVKAACKKNAQSAVEEHFDAMRKEVVGEPAAEAAAESRDSARSAFAQLSAPERATKMRMARHALFDSSLVSNKPEFNGDYNKGNRGNFGRGHLFSRSALLYLRALSEVGPALAWKRSMEIAATAGNHDIAAFIEERVLQAGSATGAGAYIPEPFSLDFISALYSTSIVRRAGATVVDMTERGNLTIPKQITSAAANWLATENAAIPASQGTYGQVTLAFKKLGVFVPISNDAIRYALGSFDALVANDMIAAATIAEDVAMLLGDGTGGAPTGIVDRTNASNKFTAATGGANDFVDQSIDLFKAEFKVENSNVLTQRPAWLMPVRERMGLMLTKQGDGHGYAFRDEMVMNGTLNGVPYYSTSHIPTNTGVGTDEGLVIYGEMSSAIIGESLNISLAESDSASYNDGAVQHAFQQDERVLRLIHEMDFNVRHDLAFGVIQGTTYGAVLD